MLTVKLVDRLCVGIHFLYPRVQSVEGDIEALLNSIMVGAPELAGDLHLAHSTIHLDEEKMRDQTHEEVLPGDLSIRSFDSPLNSFPNFLLIPVSPTRCPYC